MMNYFTGDQHFGHERIIEYINRPFNSVELMDKTLITEWNRVVKPSDTVYHLGDFCLGSESIARRYFLRLNGKILILGNTFHHDRRWLKAKKPFWSRQHEVTILPPIYTLRIDDEFMVLCHFPLARWPRQHYDSLHLYSHVHGRYQSEGLAIDVGIDNAVKVLGSYRPFSLREIQGFMKNRVP